MAERPMHKPILWLLTAALLALAACGTPDRSGPGGGSDPDPGSDPPPPEVGLPDPTFGEDRDGDGVPDGLKVIRVDGGEVRVRGMLRLGGGKILVVGGIKLDTDRAWQMALWRFNPDGTPDTSFGRDADGDGTPDGYVRFSYAGVQRSLGYDLDIGYWRGAPYIYVAGRLEWSSGSGGFDAAVWRYTADGEPDSDFHFYGPSVTARRNFVTENGMAAADGEEQGWALEVDGDRVYVTGYAKNASGDDELVVWALDKTSIFVNPHTYEHWDTDTAFGTGGWARWASADGRAVGRDISVRGGHIYVAGYAHAAGRSADMAVWALEPDGSFAADFPEPGRSEPFLHHDAAGGDSADTGAALYTDTGGDARMYVAGGSVAPGALKPVVWRLERSGGRFAPQAGPWADSFGPGGQGYVVLEQDDASSYYASAFAVRWGSLYVAGDRGRINGEALLVWKLADDGTLEARSEYASGDFWDYRLMGMFTGNATEPAVTLLAQAMEGSREVGLLLRLD